MGLTYTTVNVSNWTKSKPSFEGLFLVDTGSIDCMVYEADLIKAGIEPEGKRCYELADGRSVEYQYGFAKVSFMGDETVAQVVFSPEKVEPILGVVALEQTGYGVDPISKTLKKMTAIYLK